MYVSTMSWLWPSFAFQRSRVDRPSVCPVSFSSITTCNSTHPDRQQSTPDTVMLNLNSDLAAFHAFVTLA